jgi:hypothetical protein
VNFCRPKIIKRLFTGAALLNAMIGMVAGVVSLGDLAWFSGICYFLIAPVLFFNGLFFKHQVKKWFTADAFIYKTT